MGKSNPAQEVKAAPYTPESERIRVQNIQEQSSQSSWKIPASTATKGVSATQNSTTSQAEEKLGDILQKKTPWRKDSAPKQNAPAEPQPSEGEYAFLKNRLNLGWDKLIVAQKDICQKATDLIHEVEAPQGYSAVKKSTTSSRKSRGCILDYRCDDPEIRRKQEAFEEAKHAKNKDRKKGRKDAA